MTDPASEAGYSLLELVMCTALLIAGCVLALGLLPTVARASQAELIRGAATDVARNALERARAAAAYYPPAAVSDPGARAVTTAGHAWAFAATSTYTAGLHVHRAFCGATAATANVAAGVTMTYDAPSDTLTVSVSYPPDPCAPSVQSTVTLTAQLAPASYAPQTQLPAAIADPVEQ